MPYGNLFITATISSPEQKLRQSIFVFTEKPFNTVTSFAARFLWDYRGFTGKRNFLASN